MEKQREFKKTGVKVESADTVCGEIPHMTVDQLAERLAIDSRELRCPSCGRIHLTEEDVKNAQARRFSDTERYKEIKTQAEGDR